jgi:hypothetical protein
MIEAMMTACADIFSGEARFLGPTGGPSLFGKFFRIPDIFLLLWILHEYSIQRNFYTIANFLPLEISLLGV